MNSAPLSVDAPQAERQRLPDRLHGFLYGHFPPAEHGPGLVPRGVHVGDVERMGTLAIAPGPAVRHEVQFREVGDGDVPAVGFQRNVVLEQRPGLGAPVAPLLSVRFTGRSTRSICRGLMS